jgi:Trm5-related predicted tRNA methylase
MPDPSKSVARALAAVRDAAELLELAQRAVERARVELRSDALGVADRLSQQIQFLRKVTEVLGHEAERPGTRATAGPAAIGQRQPER